MDAPYSHNATFLINYLDLPEAVGDPAANWEAFQIRHLNNTSLLAIDIKARQVGWSWLAAAEAVAIAAENPRTPCIFVSINQDEAGEKIRYAKVILECLDREKRPKIFRDNKFELEFQNGSRLISHPCRPVRGKAKAWVYLDEFAHYPNDREIYQSAVPVITKGGKIRIGSSPLGASGMFWEIYSQSIRPYPGYVRQWIPWWRTTALCKDVKHAKLLASHLDTETRVRMFGTERLIQIFENVPLDDFQQEYECAWVDEAVAWIDWELIKRNQVLASQERLIYKRVSGVEAGLAAIDEIFREIAPGHIEDVMVAGMDIGRTHDKSEIVVLGKSTSGQLPFRLGISLDRIEFDDQFMVADRLLTDLPISLMLIDMTGLGMQIAENLHKRHSDRAQGVLFSNDSKSLWAVEEKLRFQRGEVPIPMDREFSYQVHSIKRKVTQTKNSVFDTEANSKHHADQFWAHALAVWAGKDSTQQLESGENPLGNYRG